MYISEKYLEKIPTELGPNTDPNAENHTQIDSATVLNSLEATNEAKYLVWNVADCPNPNMNDPMSINIVEL